MVPELIVILGAGVILFGFPIRGNIFSILFLSLLGTISFTGLGLLAACRAQKLETVSGIMNVIMMPMWLLSGVFFSPERFPDVLQPFIQALPLTQFNYALRAVILEGASLSSQLWRIGIHCGLGRQSPISARSAGSAGTEGYSGQNRWHEFFQKR